MKSAEIDGRNYVSFIPETVTHEIHPGMNSLRMVDSVGDELHIMLFPSVESDIVRLIEESRK